MVWRLELDVGGGWFLRDMTAGPGSWIGALRFVKSPAEQQFIRYDLGKQIVIDPLPNGAVLPPEKVVERIIRAVREDRERAERRS